MNDSSADRDPQVAEVETDATGGADKQWPDEAKIVPDTYLGEESKE